MPVRNETEDATGRRIWNGSESRGTLVGSERGGGASGLFVIDSIALFSLGDKQALREVPVVG